jgi:hypothetical protein
MVRLALLCCVFTLSLAADPLSFNYFCNAGVQPTAFLDWSKMPAPPIFNSSGQTFTATIPVSGAPGLTATIQFSNLDSNFGSTLYSVIGNTDLQIYADNGVITITFNQPIQGVRLVANTFGRFGHTFTMESDDTNDPLSQGGTGFDSSSSGSDRPGIGQYTATPLQVVQNTKNITRVTFTFQSNDAEYQYFGLDNVRIQLGSSDESNEVPTKGLMQWLRADKGATTDPDHLGSVTDWTDQSGHNASAMQSVQARSPQFIPLGGPNCQPAVSFNGASYLAFQLPIDGWKAMTVFLVGRANNDVADGTYHSQHAALFWVENAYWGNTYVSPFQTHLAYRFGTTQVGNDPEVLRKSTIGGDFTLTTAVHDGSTDALFVNGRLLDVQKNREVSLAGMTGQGFIGQGYQNTFFTGEISEILVYDRVLKPTEFEKVSSYLMKKYGLQ